MKIRPGGPGDIAAVLALGDEAVEWMNARGNTQQWGSAPWTGSQQREAVIRGAALIGYAREEAAARGIGLIRVDCWAGEDGSLVRVYEKYGFSRVQEFTVALLTGPWPGMLLAMRLPRQ